MCTDRQLHGRQAWNLSWQTPEGPWRRRRVRVRNPKLASFHSHGLCLHALGRGSEPILNFQTKPCRGGAPASVLKGESAVIVHVQVACMDSHHVCCCSCAEDLEDLAKLFVRYDRVVCSSLNRPAFSQGSRSKMQGGNQKYERRSGRSLQKYFSILIKNVFNKKKRAILAIRAIRAIRANTASDP